MDNNTVIYSKDWTLGIIDRLKSQSNEMKEVEKLLNSARATINPLMLGDLLKIINDVQDLEHSLELTKMAMENYLYDMEKSIIMISSKIEEANQTSVKLQIPLERYTDSDFGGTAILI